MVQQPRTEEVPPPQQDQPEHAYEDASRSTTEFIQNIGPLKAHKQKIRKHRYILIAFILLLTLGGGGYALYAYTQRTPEKEPAQQASHSEGDDETESENGQKRYTSTDLNLSFKYPHNWKINDEDQKVLRLESPIVKLPDQTGQEVDAKVILSVVSKSTDMSGFPEDQATGVRESEKFKYDSPAEGQRQESFLSFMNLSGVSDGLNAIYITGDSNYVKGDPITKADFEKVTPVIWLEFYACPNQACSDEKVTISVESWGTNTTLKQAFTILKSFNIK